MKNRIKCPPIDSPLPSNFYDVRHVLFKNKIKKNKGGMSHDIYMESYGPSSGEKIISYF